MAVRKRLRMGRCIVALLLLCCLLVVGINLAVRRSTQESPDSTPETSGQTEGETSSETSTAPPEESPTQPDPSESSTDPAASGDITGTAKNFAFQEGQVYIRVGREKPIPLKIYNMAVTMEDITWTVSDDRIAVVSSDGTLTALQKGECTVTASHGDEAVQIPVTVRELEVIDGCTFVDGILIVNKTYDLPAEYDPGLLEVTEKAFERMCDDAAEEGYDLYIGSGYRSYQSQVESYDSIVTGYSQEYADIISARPGHSEHQSGYTIDCNTIDNTFIEEGVGQWVQEHCAEYGFIVRYPEDKTEITGYAYESWHLRYVGVDAAREITEQGLCLEEYLDVDSRYADGTGNTDPSDSVHGDTE